MDKEFVPYKLALRMKQLGFDEPCFAYYNIDPQLKSPGFNLVKPFDHEWCLPAPLYQQAFRWFREKYGLYYSVEYYIEDYKYPCFLFKIKNKPDNLPIKYKGLSGYNTYEEAELACLEKLIEIVEQSKSE